ncbi:hypothetical protein [Corynebacterium kozikiae]|uniref:hypothetical protein n=1 Tax=Corynebacterium kozikiae TaxID=2968469 RepID=UPI00211C313E|nr:hypothetical protein [Corynebacterium sp. 76QC2CO]MCQ9343233.1 hypothetical protein [Corynebacterium sp. 76QC2CO]
MPSTPSSRATLLHAYEEQLRTHTELGSFPHRWQQGPLWIGADPAAGLGFITHRQLPRYLDPTPLIQGALRSLTQDPSITEIEWKTRGHDVNQFLPGALEALGFVRQDPETVMAGSTSSVIACAPELPSEYAIEQMNSFEDITQAMVVSSQVFEMDTPESLGIAARLAKGCAQGELEVWAVRHLSSGDIVCVGRVEFVEGTSFAGVWGGGCLEAHRGQGLYRALTATRAARAEARSHALLYADCTEFSRPILQKSGLVPITTTTPYFWRR